MHLIQFQQQQSIMENLIIESIIVQSWTTMTVPASSYKIEVAAEILPLNKEIIL